MNSDDFLENTISLTPITAPSEYANPVPAWIISTLLHMIILIAIATLQVPESRRRITQVIRLIPQRVVEEETPLVEFDFRKLDVGPESAGGEPNVEVESPSTETPEVALVDLPTVTLPSIQVAPVTGFEAQRSLQTATGNEFYRRYKTKGLVGVGTDSTEFAIDRLTRETLLLLEERPTLVVWLLDQSASLIPQRAQIHQRLDRIYREIGAVQASGTPGRREDRPLISSVIAFGKDVTLRLKRPTDDVEKLKRAVAGIERDDSGIENVFHAVNLAADKFRKFRRNDSDTGQPLRNVAFIVFTDEAGDDQNLLEDAVAACQRIEIPVFVVGVPAPFGQPETVVKWVDPNPAYDQTPGWGRVNQGPESALPERIRLGSATDPEDQTPIDSGFGPYALTRLCYETGGIYFAVHPDRRRARPARRAQVQPFSAHFGKFFAAETMRQYRPDYVSQSDYEKLLNENSARSALVRAAGQSWIGPMKDPRQTFIVRTEAQFASELTEAQKQAAVLEPRLNRLFAILKQGEDDRSNEEVPRWQAGYDLAMGRTLAALVRTSTYNAVLAKAKRGLQPTNPKHNTWTIAPAREVAISRDLKMASEKAQQYLERVVEQHPETPWAFLASRELRKPLGWKWRDSYTPTPEERQMANRERRRTPRDEQARAIERRPIRDVPRL